MALMKGPRRVAVVGVPLLVCSLKEVTFGDVIISVKLTIY